LALCASLPPASRRSRAPFQGSKARRRTPPLQVILLEDYGLELQPRPRPVPQPLVLMHTQQLQVHLAKESAAYWRGLEISSGAAMLRACPALAFGPGGSSAAAAEKLELLREACAGEGVPLGALAAQEVAGRFGGAVRLPNGYGALVQPDGGGLLLPVEAGAALGALCKQAGVVLRDNLVLRGWRDAGHHFVVRASSRMMPDVMSVFEAEQLLLAPGHWVPSSWAVFGLGSKLSTLQVACSRVAAGSALRKAPIWHLLGDDGPGAGASIEAAAATAGASALGAAAAFTPSSEQRDPPSCAGLPLLAEGGRASLLQASWAGQPLAGPDGFQQEPAGGQLAAAKQVHATALRHVRGLGEWELASSSCQVMHGTEDGLPVAGYHPGGLGLSPLLLAALAVHPARHSACSCTGRARALTAPPYLPQATKPGASWWLRPPAAAARRWAWATAATTWRPSWPRRRQTCSGQATAQTWTRSCWAWAGRRWRDAAAGRRPGPARRHLTRGRGCGSCSSGRRMP
jgi:hypothetical protein